jgi:hypothetical protein
MAINDLVGVPIPVGMPEFKNDARLLRKIRQLESFIEINHDMEDVEDALKALRNSLKNENQQTITSLFGCLPWTISECCLSYAVVLYSKAFTEGTGRSRLNDNVSEIFGPDIDKHNTIIYLRNGFYAHQGIEANRHQLFYFPKGLEPGKVRFNPNGQTTRIPMAKNVKFEIIELCISKVRQYLQLRIDGLCANIENELTKDKLAILVGTPKEELINNHWRESSGKRLNPFSGRKK